MNWILGLFGIGEQYLENKKVEKQAKHNVKMAGIENRARQLRDTESNNHEWEMKALEGRDKLLQRFSFFMFSLPFVVAMVNPEIVKNYFEVALASMPTWYIQLFASIVGGVWGFAALKDTLPSIVNAFRNRK